MILLYQQSSKMMMLLLTAEVVLNHTGARGLRVSTAACTHGGDKDHAASSKHTKACNSPFSKSSGSLPPSPLLEERSLVPFLVVGQFNMLFFLPCDTRKHQRHFFCGVQFFFSSGRGSFRALSAAGHAEGPACTPRRKCGSRPGPVGRALGVENPEI